jgi:Peptidase family M23
MTDRLISAAALLVSALTSPVYAADPYPAQLNVSFLAQPAPIVQDGATRLYYEMLVTNFGRSSYVLDSIDASVGDINTHISGKALNHLITELGPSASTENSPETEKSLNRKLDGGRSAIVFLKLDLGKKAAPSLVANTLHVVDDSGTTHDVTVSPLAILDESPMVVAAPLRGEWIAGDSVSDRPDAAHRRAVMIDDGHAWLAQRFAIDWVQYQTVDGKRTTWKGPEDRNESYFCYDKLIYSVAAGDVVDASDGMPDNVPHSGKNAVTVDFQNAAGNHAVIEIAPHRFVLYAHIRPGTLQVKKGDHVSVGQIIGHVGNTGSSAEPHLHMHIDDHPSFLGGNGVPYVFAAGKSSGAVEANVSSPTAIYLGPIGSQKQFVNDYPAENALVTFK